jgi:hypothetical protein
VEITFVQLAAQTRNTHEASKFGINRIFVPTDMLFAIGVYGNAGEVAH